MKTPEIQQEVFFDEGARQLLSGSGLSDFQSLWKLDIGWVEEPNQCRGGWSGVSRCEFPWGAIYIKRQENHVYRTLRHFFMPRATLQREYENLIHFRRIGIPTLDLLYFGQGLHQGKTRAILVTRELEHFHALDAAPLNPLNRVSRSERTNLIKRIAAVVRRMHENNFQHNCLYPKHIFVRHDPAAGWEVRLIDLEKAKWRLLRRWVVIRDWGTLYRHASGWSRADQLRLFLSYRQEERLSSASRELLRLITRKRKNQASVVSAG